MAGLIWDMKMIKNLLFTALTITSLSALAADSDMMQMHFTIDGLVKSTSVPSITWQDVGADGISCKDIVTRNPSASGGVYNIYVAGSTHDVICLMPEGYTLAANINYTNRKHTQPIGYGSVAVMGAGLDGKLPDDVINELFTESLQLRCVGNAKFIPKSSDCDVWAADAATIDGDGNLHCANSFSIAHASAHLGAAYYTSSSNRVIYGSISQNGCFNNTLWGQGGELFVK